GPCQRPIPYFLRRPAPCLCGVHKGSSFLPRPFGGTTIDPSRVQRFCQLVLVEDARQAPDAEPDVEEEVGRVPAMPVHQDGREDIRVVAREGPVAPVKEPDVVPPARVAEPYDRRSRLENHLSVHDRWLSPRHILA